jgi:hypothetical protein
LIEYDVPEPHASDPAAARVSKFQDGFERQIDEDDPNEKNDHDAILMIKDKTDKAAMKIKYSNAQRLGASC